MRTGWKYREWITILMGASKTGMGLMPIEEKKSHSSWGTILLVDDAVASRKVLRVALESNGFYQCVEAATGREALDILETEEIDLVLLDMFMPEVSGLDVLKTIRQRFTDTQLPVIVITALDETISVVTALELGATDYVVKPFEFPVLHARVRAPLARRNAEQKLFAAMKAAEHADQVKSRMFSRMGHELRTPLNAIIGFTDLMLDGDTGNLNPTQTEYLSHIFNAGRDLMALVNDIMTLSAIDGNELVLNIRRFDPTPQVENALALLQSLAQSKNVTVSIASDLADMPRIEADPARFQQILIGLLSNAIKFNRPNGQVTISFEVTRTNALRLYVEDTGYGIAEEHRDNIYEPSLYRQVDQAVQPSSGMGLTIARELVRRMGGEIDFSSRYGVGSRFWFDLPVDQKRAKDVTEADQVGSSGARPIIFNVD